MKPRRYDPRTMSILPDEALAALGRRAYERKAASEGIAAAKARARVGIAHCFTCGEPGALCRCPHAREVA